MKISIIASKFNQTISDKLVAGAKKALEEEGITQVPINWVPGAFELPLACSWLVRKYDALIALGAVIRGETPHFDYVCSVASQGIADVSKSAEKPIGFGVITANTVDQAVARSADNEENFGFRAAKAALQMLRLKEKIEDSPPLEKGD